jgi:hypothetical protein
MASVKRFYVVPSVASFSESEVLDLLGPARTYPGAESATSSSPDPSDPSGTSSKSGRGKSKTGK